MVSDKNCPMAKRIECIASQEFLLMETLFEKRNGLVLYHELLHCAILYSLYIKHDMALLYIEKIDTTGLHELKGAATRLVRSLVQEMAGQYPKLNVHVYCATSSQYLFPDSAQVKGKRIRSERNLIQWWLACLTTCWTDANPNIQATSFCFMPEESMFTVKSLFPSGSIDLKPSDDSSSLKWKWGLGVDEKEKASVTLPAFSDDLVTKAMDLAPDATVGEVMELMGVAEAGSRALISMHFTCSDATKPVDTLVSQSDFEEMMCILYSGSYKSKESALKSSKILWEFLEKKATCCFDDFEQGSEVKSVSEPKKVVNLNVAMIKKKPLSQPAVLSQGLVKRKKAVDSSLNVKRRIVEEK